MFIRSKGQLTIPHIHPNPKPRVEMQSLTGQLLMPFKYFQGEKTFAAMAEMQERCNHQQNAPGMQGVCGWAG